MNDFQTGFVSRMQEHGLTEVEAIALLDAVTTEKQALMAPNPVGEFMTTVARTAKNLPGTQHPLIKLKMPLIRSVIARAATPKE